MSLDHQLRTAVREALAEALADADWPTLQLPAEEEGWRSRVHRVHPDTRLSLGEVAEVLDVSERTVRRYLAGEVDHPPLPHDRGPGGLTVQAGVLLQWIRDVEDAERWRERRVS